METRIHTDNELYNNFLPQIKDFLDHDHVTYEIDGERVHGYRSPDCNAIWIRDHSDMLRGAKYFDTDTQTAVTHFANTQRGNGSLFDFVSCAMDNENWTKYVRVPVEADVEYRFVKGIWLAWQSNGDDEWLEWVLPFAEKALNYSLTHPHRWDDTNGLIKRAYTMDTWDFDYVSQGQNKLNFRITDDTHWGIFHGDNSGFYEAFVMMSALYKNLENSFKADYWQEWAERFRERANDMCWNGNFYKHRVALDDFTIAGVNEAEQLSFSNPMAINRGLTDHKMAVAMLQEYQDRKQKSDAFAEWFSMEPAFPDGSFGDPKLVAGAYINGGIMPLVGGELARAAFEHGFEKYGHQILTQYAQKIKETGETYLWYFPDGTASTVETSTSPDAMPTDGWGSSAMLYGYVEGLAGVVDHGACFRDVRCSPRWAAADVKSAEVKLRYPASMTSFDYDYTLRENSCTVELHAYSHVQLHLLLPDNKNVSDVQVDGQKRDFETSRIENSQYLDVDLDIPGTAKVEVNFS